MFFYINPFINPLCKPTSVKVNSSIVSGGVVVTHLHAAVVLQQGHQVAVLADLVLDVPHEGPDARLVAAVGVARHAALEEVLLLRVFLQRHKELSHLVLLLARTKGHNSRKETRGESSYRNRKTTLTHV